NAANHSRCHEVRQNAGANQRGFSRSARTQEQHKCRSPSGSTHQCLGNGSFGQRTTKENRRLFDVERLKTAIWRARPPIKPVARLARGQLGQTAAQKLPQVLFELCFELVEVLEAVEGGFEGAVRRLEIPLPET